MIDEEKQEEAKLYLNTISDEELKKYFLKNVHREEDYFNLFQMLEVVAPFEANLYIKNFIVDIFPSLADIKKEFNKVLPPFEINYEIIVDKGEYGTKTIFSTTNYQEAISVLEEVKQENFSNVDLYEDEKEDVISISLFQTIEAPTQLMQSITYGKTTETGIELYTGSICPKEVSNG